MRNFFVPAAGEYAFDLGKPRCAVRRVVHRFRRHGSDHRVAKSESGRKPRLFVEAQCSNKEHTAVLDFTHGHPLALSLVADVFAERASFHFQPEQRPTSSKYFWNNSRKKSLDLRTAPRSNSVLIRLTTESLLAEMLGVPDAHELFEWLRGLSFIQSGAHGIFPHDLAREAMTADLRWRNRIGARNCINARVIRQTPGSDERRRATTHSFRFHFSSSR